MLTGNQLQDKLRTWLSPPNPSINHNTACEIHHRDTSKWFIQGTTFREWKENGSLLWIRGNRKLLRHFSICMRINSFPKFAAGAGKSILWYVFCHLFL